MVEESITLKLYRAKNTVFTFKEISLLLKEVNRDILKSKINYYVKKDVLRQVRRGIYVKPDYDRLELASKIYTPSYISLETVLQRNGVIFQYYEKIFALSYLSRLIKVDGHEIRYRKIRNDILLNSWGIIWNKNYAIASKERAFLDCVYLYRDYHFDNLDALDKRKVFDLAKIYKSSKFENKVQKILG
ncbi:MAG: hypothetical protein KGY69_18055 [Bacteroidales bacterium]|nr:hypothetical protein [Bacteroidales bacterium]